jgi:SAM-dependent methyltransferase
VEQRYTEVNSNVWDRWAAGDEPCPWTIPVSPEEIARARAGDWGVYLTPCIPVPKDWFLPFPGCQLLGLASGGGQQMPIFAALGADCTILDYADSQLQKERDVAAREGYGIRIVKADMTLRLPFEDASFDLIFHPVSNCYIEDVRHVWDECFRVLRPGGVLLAGFDNGINFLFDGDDPLRVVNRLPVNPLKLPPEEQRRRLAECGGSFQFSHTMEEQIGGQLAAGLWLTHLYEDRDRPGEGAEIGAFAPQYLATRAVKPAA